MHSNERPSRTGRSVRLWLYADQVERLDALAKGLARSDRSAIARLLLDAALQQIDELAGEPSLS
jgi:hypothetical protein